MKIKTRDMILVALFASLSAIGAFIKIPIGPAPISLQLLFVALSGIILGSKLGALSQIIYVLLGLIGLPVFTEGGGITYIFKPSFGYLLGFILASYIIGKIIETNKEISFIKILITSITGSLLVYLIGVPYMYFIVNNVMHVSMSLNKTLQVGFIVFLPGDLIKCIIVAFLSVKIIPALNFRANFQ